MRSGYVVSPRADWLLFGGPVLIAAIVALVSHQLGVLHTDLPPWGFALLIVGVDVAHVYSTAFRVYLDRQEFKRRVGLYLGVPLACYGVGVAAHAAGGPDLFWRLLAYTAVFHFVRQQWGWMAYSRRRAGEEDDLRLDQVAIYNATVFPILWWHMNLPRSSSWFVEGDFVSLPAAAAPILHGVHLAIVAYYVVHQLRRHFSGRGVNAGKMLVWASTWAIWYGGIVALDSDIVFTTSNVLAHGIPYLAVVWGIQRERWEGVTGGLGKLFRPGLAWLYLAILVAVGYSEEWLWDRFVWHEHDGLFPGPAAVLDGLLLSLLVPLLAVPQATHYVLDGWIWRTRDYSDLKGWLKD